ncbi:hypothetical protein B0H14DRAFT_2986021 [Mycena olivaceomarginata]|nr:hypothetical protein B0H14DRAFT_2986021 [Mycena olivaceomarginata]
MSVTKVFLVCPSRLSVAIPVAANPDLLPCSSLHAPCYTTKTQTLCSFLPSSLSSFSWLSLQLMTATTSPTPAVSPSGSDCARVRERTFRGV